MNQGAPSTLPSEGESVELQPSQVDLGGEQNETNSNIHRVFDLDEKYRLVTFSLFLFFFLNSH